MNTTILYNGTGGLGDVVLFVQDASNGLFMTCIILAVFIIALLISMRKIDFVSSAAVAGWLTFLLCLPLSMGHMISIVWPISLLILAAVSTIYLYSTR